jgi:hypothetical protein
MKNFIKNLKILGIGTIPGYQVPNPLQQLSSNFLKKFFFIFYFLPPSLILPTDFILKVSIFERFNF